MSHLWLFIFSLQILKTLHRTYAIMKMKSVWNDINPKAVTTDELFGYLHPATREWKDGENYTKKKMLITTSQVWTHLLLLYQIRCVQTNVFHR